MEEINIEELLTKIYDTTYEDVLRYVTSKCRNKNYINAICAEVRNKRVHEEIKEELYSHLKEKATEYLNCGKNENDALKLAINEMGSSKHIGQELNELPEFYGKYIFSSIVYNFGWIAGFIIIILITALLIKIYKISKNIKNNYGKILILGIESILGIQIVLHMLSNFGFINGYVQLPFISYALTSIVFNMFIIGIIINVYKGRSISRVELS